MTFDEWWEQNGRQYSADACHMSEYHIASVVWNAAKMDGVPKDQVFPETLRAKVFNAAKPIKTESPRMPFVAFMDGIEPLIVEIAKLRAQVDELQQNAKKE